MLGQAGKSTRKYKNYFNIEYLVASSMSQHQSFMNLDNVKHINLLDEIALDVTNPKTKLVIKIDSCFDDAKQNELISWQSNNFYQAVPNTNQKCIFLRCVHTMKDNLSSLRPKAQLVA